MSERILSLGEIEQRIMDVDDALEEATHDYADFSDAAAIAEADYKRAFASAVVRMVSLPVKLNAMEKQAHADQASADLFRVWRLAEAQRASSREVLLSLRARLDALRTLSSNVKMMTAPNR